MRTLRDLLTTRENWSARETLTRALERASTDEAAGVLRRNLGKVAETDPLDALADSTELVSVVCGWRW